MSAAGSVALKVMIFEGIDTPRACNLASASLWIMAQSNACWLAKIRAYRFAGWELNVRVRRLKSPQGEQITLRNAEFNLLAAFLASPLRVLTREQLLSMSHLHNDEVYDRAIDTQVGRLRKKLEEHGAGDQLISTERGAGYVLTVPVEVVR